MKDKENEPNSHRYINNKFLKPIEPECISYYLALVDEEIISVSNDEYEYFRNKLNTIINQANIPIEG